MSRDTINKTTLGINLIPNEDNTKVGEEIRIEGSVEDLACAYVSLTKHLLASVASNTDAGFVATFYASVQKLIAEESCLKDVCKVYEIDKADVAKRFGPLMNILGKTFTIPDEKGEAE